MNLLKQKWHTVGQPWGDGGWGIAGHHDPHAGRFVFDCQGVNDDEIDAGLSAIIARHIVDLHNASLMDDRGKKQALTALVASAFTQYKKILSQDQNETHIPPGPSDSRAAYCNDPLIRRCVDVVVAGVSQIMVR